ncbi:MAG: patatin-like phospholipase family protein [Prolixibacteraceae bacterium]|nr:patatin-like phospholipase family protein [Prolixibacteraceae bacterium]
MLKKFIQVSILSILGFSLSLTYPFISSAQENHEKTGRPKIALVLSGGGAKGFAHIGVLKVLEEEGIPIDMIVGTSMGSLVGGIYSLGYSASELETLVKSLKWETVLTDDVQRAFLSKNDQLLKQRYIFSLPITKDKKLSLPQGLIKGQNVLNIFCGLAGNVPSDVDFSKLPIPFACVATDLETGNEVIIKDGFLPTAMFSSMAIPLAFQPVSHNGRLLVDGGIVNNFPTDVAKKMGADIIIGVDIRGDFRDQMNLKSINGVLSQLVNFFDKSKDSINKSLCNLIIKPDVSGYSVSSFNNQAVDTLILRGEKATRNFRTELRQLKTKYNLKPRQVSRTLVQTNRWHINKLTFTGNFHLEQEFLQKTLNMEIPGDYSSEEIKMAIDKLYGLGGFDRIFYNLIDTGNGETLNFNISTQEVFTQDVGFKANTTDAAAIMVNTTRKNYKNVFGLLSASVELSVNPGIILVAESNRTNVPTLGINLKGKYQNYNVFDKGKKAFEANILYSSGAIYLYKPFMKQFHLGLGLQEEYYHGDIFSKNNTSLTVSNQIDQFLTSGYSYLSFDNMDDFYFPTRGSDSYAEFSMITDWKNSNKLSPILLYKTRNVIPLSQKTALLLDLYGRSLFNSDYPPTKTTMIGGEPYSQYFNYHLPFVGLSAVSFADRYVNIGLIGLRFNFADSQYFSILFNAMVQGNESLGLTNVSTTYGGGVKYALKTFLGPLDVTLGYSGSTRKPSFSANFGYWF